MAGKSKDDQKQNLNLHMIKIIKTISKEEKLYVAVSMGVDSLAALHWLIWKKYNVVGVHFNHKLRKQNDEMEKSFQNFCKKFNIENLIGEGSNLKTEAECRKARIKFYTDKIQNGTIVTAHHLNDWVEGYLLNCFRGKPDHDPIPLKSEFKNFQIIHPFLLTKKKDFQQYIDRNGLRPYTVEDETNSYAKGSRRNWIRQFLIPEMKRQELNLEKYAEKRIRSLTLGSVCQIGSNSEGS